MANFAKAQLLKYGWTEGKGLGRDENGITEPVKANLKFDTAGIGHKTTDTNQWWQTAFNNAAKNINVELQDESVSISVHDKDDTDQNNSKSQKTNNTTSYSNFLKTSTLRNGNLIHENGLHDEKGELKKTEVYVPLSDDEIFKACGGRTAHKGARHGLTLNGKLERIAQQEKILLGTNETTVSESKVSDCSTETILPTIEASQTFQKSKSAKRAEKKRINYLTRQLSMACSITENTVQAESNTVEKKKGCLKRKRSRERNTNIDDASKNTSVLEVDNETGEIPFSMDDEFCKSKIKKKKTCGKKLNVHFEINTHKDSHFSDCKKEEGECNCFASYHKKRKSKRKKDQHNKKSCSDFTLVNDNETRNTTSRKSRKKRHKKMAGLVDVMNSIYLQNVCANQVANEGKASTKNELSKRVKSHKTSEKLPLLKQNCISSESPQTSPLISKNWKLRSCKKKKEKLDKLGKNMMAICIDTKNKSNSSKQVKSEKKLETIMENLMAVSLAENVSAKIKAEKRIEKKGK